MCGLDYADLFVSSYENKDTVILNIQNKTALEF